MYTVNLYIVNNSFSKYAVLLNASLKKHFNFNIIQQSEQKNTKNILYYIKTNNLSTAKVYRSQ